MTLHMLRDCVWIAFLVLRVGVSPNLSFFGYFSALRLHVSHFDGPSQHLALESCCECCLRVVGVQGSPSYNCRASSNRIRMYAGPVSWVSNCYLGCTLPVNSCIVLFCFHGDAAYR
jgi:hypothetical protein